jgi:hypothetical protein
VGRFLIEASAQTVGKPDFKPELMVIMAGTLDDPSRVISHNGFLCGQCATVGLHEPALTQSSEGAALAWRGLAVERTLSAFGTKRTSNFRLAMSAFGGKADITFDRCNVCFLPKADTIGLRWLVCFWLEGELAKIEELNFA